MSVDYVVSTLEVSLCVIVQCDLDVVQDDVSSVVVPAVLGVLVGVYVVCKCKCHNRTEA